MEAGGTLWKDLQEFQWVICLEFQLLSQICLRQSRTNRFEELWRRWRIDGLKVEVTFIAKEIPRPMDVAVTRIRLKWSFLSL